MQETYVRTSFFLPDFFVCFHWFVVRHFTAVVNILRSSSQNCHGGCVSKALEKRKQMKGFQDQTEYILL